MSSGINNLFGYTNYNCVTFNEIVIKMNSLYLNVLYEFDNASIYHYVYLLKRLPFRENVQCG